MNDTITITKAQLQTALKKWEQDARDGKTLPLEESRALSAEECAANSAYHLWNELQTPTAACPLPPTRSQGNSSMTPIELIAEWRKGCSNTLDADGDQSRHPERCQQCTRALIDALEARLTADSLPTETPPTPADKQGFEPPEYAERN